MRFRFEHKPYQRAFRKPMETSRGYWERRRGGLIRLENDAGQVGFGEVAPIEAFGTETVEEAFNFLRSLGGEWDGNIPKGLPCCSFAFKCAQSWISGNFRVAKHKLGCAALLPAAEAALSAQVEKLSEGYEVFKWKAATREISLELEIASELSARGKLRVDANEGLDPQETRVWLEHLDSLPNVEYLEQPMPRGRWRDCLPLVKEYKTPIALDEDAPNATGWPGLKIVKPVLGMMSTGDVFSSALETSIGKEAALRMAIESDQALGFGVGDLFEEDGLDLHPSGPEIIAGLIGHEEMEAIWKEI